MRKSGLGSWEGNDRPVKLIAQLLRQDALAGEAWHELGWTTGNFWSFVVVLLKKTR